MFTNNSPWHESGFSVLLPSVSEPREKKQTKTSTYTNAPYSLSISSPQGQYTGWPIIKHQQVTNKCHTWRCKFTSNGEPHRSPPNYHRSPPNCLILDRIVIVLDRTAIVLNWTVIILRWTFIVLDQTVIILHPTVIILSTKLSSFSTELSLFSTKTSKQFTVATQFPGLAVGQTVSGYFSLPHTPDLPTLSCLSDDRYVYKTLPCAGLFPGARSCSLNRYSPEYAYVSSANRDPDTHSWVGGPPSTSIRVYE